MFPNDSTNELAPQVKRCSKCGVDKPISEFNKEKRRKDGLFPHCRDCYKEYQAERRATPRVKEMAKGYNKKWYEESGGREVARKRAAQDEYREQRREYAQSPQGKEAKMRGTRKRRIVHPDKYKANNAVNNAVRDGKLPHISTQACKECGNQAVEYHHHSYEPEFWLDVSPLCRDCHTKTYTTPYE